MHENLKSNMLHKSGRVVFWTTGESVKRFPNDFKSGDDRDF